MRTFVLSPRVLILSVATALLAGCGASQFPAGASGGMPQSLVRGRVPDWRAQHLARAECPQVWFN